MRHKLSAAYYYRVIIIFGNFRYRNYSSTRMKIRIGKQVVLSHFENNNFDTKGGARLKTPPKVRTLS